MDKNKIIFDEAFEALLRKAIIANLDAEIEELEEEISISEPYVFSDSHTKQVKKLFTRAHRQERLATFAKWGKGFAAAAVITMALLFGALMLMPEVRAVIVETVVQWYEQFVRFVNPNAPAVEPADWELTWVPDGYELAERSENFDAFINKQGNVITFAYGTLSDVLMVDNEDVSHRQTHIDGTEYHVFEWTEPTRIIMVVWEFDGYRFNLTGEASLGDLVNMAESTKKK